MECIYIFFSYTKLLYIFFDTKISTFINIKNKILIEPKVLDMEKHCRTKCPLIRQKYSLEFINEYSFILAKSVIMTLY